MYEDHDLAVALQLQEQFNSEVGSKDLNRNKRLDKENIVRPASCSLVDTTWEYVDPTPDVHGMFQLFNNRFFWSKLCGVEVKWSSRMTSCAGVCCYEGRGGLCSVRLSAPLLKLRPRKDLVETMLHEMIHAYLFVTNNNRDRDGHGPEFHKHMNRINKEAGTKITVYHSFHEEVKFYQQHWWRCNGPCQRRPPFFGTVRRASNRAPGPNDFWWDDHRTTCGGTFIKIKEPVDFKSKKSVIAKGGTSGLLSNVRDIRSFFPTQSSEDNRCPKTLKDKNCNHSEKSSANSVGNNVVGFQDLGGGKQSKSVSSKSQTGHGKNIGGIGENKIRGFGGVLANKGGGTLVVTAKNKKQKMPIMSGNSKNNFVPFHGEGHVLGSSSNGCQVNDEVHVSGVSGVARRHTIVSATTKRTLETDVETSKIDQVSPTKKVRQKSIGGPGFKPFVTSPKSPFKSISYSDSRESPCSVVDILDSPDDSVQCPVCNCMVDVAEINNHLDGCVESAFSEKSSVVHCPVCNQEQEEAELSQHLESCVKCVFSDDDDDNEESGPGSSSSSGNADKLYPCPCCMTWVEPDLMNHHLDECLSSKLLSNFSDIANG